MTPETRTEALFIPTEISGAQPLASPTRIEIFTDGSCIGNPGHGGYGIVMLRLNAFEKIIKRQELSGCLRDTTNNRAEMTAACVALEAMGRRSNEFITVYCDANIIANTMNRDLAKWKARGWKRGNGQEPKNCSLWQRLEKAAVGHNVTWAWVRGHNGTEHNEQADKLAYAAALRAEKKWKD